MACDPNDNSLRPGRLPALPPIPPSLSSPTAPLQSLLPDFTFPSGQPENLNDILAALGLLFPSSLFKPNLDGSARSILDGVVSLLNQISPFLSFYKFIFSALNLLLCILDVICALNNPFAVLRAVKRLLKRCLPDFLALMPWLALIMMIISLLLLLLALIEYIIAKIIQYIEDIIKNIESLEKAVQFNDAERTLSEARKIASLLCIIENLFAILAAFAAIFQVIKDLASIAGRSVCSSGNLSPNADDPGCCGDEFCPPFIRNGDADGYGIKYNVGELIYFKQLNQDLATIFTGNPFAHTLSNGIAPQRVESWQFTDLGVNIYNIKDIITPINGSIYWPEGMVFAANTVAKKVPYFVDLRMKVNPDIFMNTSSDTKGYRWVRINNCIISSIPYVGVNTYDGGFNSNVGSGTVNLVGGTVYEDDGYTILKSNTGEPLNITNFIHINSLTVSPPGPITYDDGLYIKDIQSVLRPNEEALFAYQIITAGCLPDITVEREVINATNPIINFPGPFPNLGGGGGAGGNKSPGAIECLQAAMATFRKDVSVEGAALFQASAITCLNTLSAETKNSYKAAFNSGFSPFHSTFTIDPIIQFVGLPITITAIPRDANASPIAFGIPSDLQAEFATNLTGHATFGSISSHSNVDGYQSAFTYDSSQSGFIGQITSDIAGSGVLTMYYNGQEFSQIINRNSDTLSTSIVPIELPYTFVGRIDGSIESPVRRDDTDVSVGE